MKNTNQFWPLRAKDFVYHMLWYLHLHHHSRISGQPFHYLKESIIHFDQFNFVYFKKAHHCALVCSWEFRISHVLRFNTIDAIITIQDSIVSKPLKFKFKISYWNFFNVIFCWSITYHKNNFQFKLPVNAAWCIKWASHIKYSLLKNALMNRTTAASDETIFWWYKSKTTIAYKINTHINM